MYFQILPSKFWPHTQMHAYHEGLQLKPQVQYMARVQLAMRGLGTEKFFDDFLSIFGKNVLVLKDRILGKYRISKNWDLRDRETRMRGAVSSRGKD